jgi:hypothetical protein
MSNYPYPDSNLIAPSDPKPDFVDVHVTLDWVIRVYGETREEQAKDIATDYLADQDLQRVVEMIVHEDGVLCDGEDLMRGDYDGNLREEELTIALYPEDQELPVDVPVAVATYHLTEQQLRPTPEETAEGRRRVLESEDIARYAAEAGTADHG